MNKTTQNIKNILTLNFSELEQKRNIVIEKNIIFVDSKPLIYFTNDENPTFSIDLKYDFGFSLLNIDIKDIEFNEGLFWFKLSNKFYFNELIFEFFKQIRVTYDL